MSDRQASKLGDTLEEIGKALDAIGAVTNDAGGGADAPLPSVDELTSTALELIRALSTDPGSRGIGGTNAGVVLSLGGALRVARLLLGSSLAVARLLSSG